jgi:hypothetical protein
MLSDKEILELNELCNALIDGTLTDAQRAKLGEWLARSEEARQFYVRATSLSASLCHYASEMHADQPDIAAASVTHEQRWLWWIAPFAAAACIAAMVWAFKHAGTSNFAGESKSEEFVARLTASKQCEWANGALPPGTALQRGQSLELVRGFAEITFDSGARVVLEGPAMLEITSAWGTTLRKGVLKASVPPEAIGFSIGNEAVEVKDLGTEFTMIAYAGGSADVLVLKGEVEATPRNEPGLDGILLRENEARRFAQSGVTEVSDREQKFARFNQPVSLDRFARKFHYAHWSFDEMEGTLLKADDFGQRLERCDAKLKNFSPSLTALTVEGRAQSALRFDGRLYARAPFAGLSGNAGHSVAFWVRVPEDSQLSSAYAIVAWWAENKQIGSRPVHIGWNRNPDEGPVGVLRTDYGRGFALGSTPLRDGRWHHVAVVFVPSAKDALPEVKQYVDGRLEGEGQPSPPGGGVSTQVNEVVRDAIWLGCRLGDNGPKRERFRGDLDELCVTEGALGPPEIVQLMRENKPLSAEMAALQ